MLDSLGSTLSAETVNSFTCNGKKPVEKQFTIDEARSGSPQMRRWGLFLLRKEG